MKYFPGEGPTALCCTSDPLSDLTASVAAAFTSISDAVVSFFFDVASVIVDAGVLLFPRPIPLTRGQRTQAEVTLLADTAAWGTDTKIAFFPHNP